MRRTPSPPAPPRQGFGGTPLKQYGRRLVADARLAAKGRGILQMMLLSSKQVFTMGLNEQARQLSASPWVVRDVRRLAVQTGLFKKAPRGYERVELPGGVSFAKRFRACEPIDLTIRLATTLAAIAHGSLDGWARPSVDELADQLRASPWRVLARIKVLLRLGLVQVERESGRRNAYRPMLPLKEQASAKRTVRKLGSSSSLTVDEVVGRAFNGSRSIAASFRHDVLGAARAIDLGGASEVAVASSLVAVYAGIAAARDGIRSDDVPGPLELLRRYVEWLGDKKEWRMTTRVLSLDSPAFGQFIREETTRHPREVNSLTGR